MPAYHMGELEAQFADIIWENEPIPSPELAKIAGKRFGWKKPTAFNVLRRLCDKGIFKNEKAVVTSLISREDFYAEKSEIFIKENFNNSLPAFLVSFMGRRKLSKAEVDELYRIVDEYADDTEE